MAIRRVPSASTCAPASLLPRRARFALVGVCSLVALIGTASPARAEPDLARELREAWDLLRAEGQIERDIVRAQLRGMLSRRPAPPDWTPRTSGKGRLERGPGGVPILYLEGTPAEMGAQHGTLLRGEIQALRAYMRAFVGRRQMPAAMEQGERLFLEHCPEHLLREVRALAEAAGLSEEEALFAQWFTDLYRGFACSTVAAPSADEGTFLARNLDFPTLGYLEDYSIVVVARPAGKRPFVSVTWPGLVGVLSGQSKDLALAVLVVHGSQGVRSGLPFQLALRRALEESGDVAQAEAFLRGAPLTVTNNLMLVDRAGAARVLELHPDGLEARAPDRSGRLFATNHFQSDELRARRVSMSYLSSRRRLEAVEDACAVSGREPGPVPLEDARRALRDASMPFTAQSMIFLPGAGAIEVAFTTDPPAAKERFVRLGPELLLGD